MRLRSSRPATGAVVVCLLLALVPLTAGASAVGEVELPRLDLLGTEAVSSVTAPVTKLGDSLRPKVSGIRVALISSGVDASALPTELRSQIAHPWGTGDAEGYGTYAASVLLQVADDVEITSLPVFHKGRADAARQNKALDWAKRNHAKLDVVLLAFSPHFTLDPVSRAMEVGEWDDLMRVAGDHPTLTPQGAVFGVDLDPHRRSLAMQGATVDERRLADRFVASVSAWRSTSHLVEAVTASGVPIVVPSGDLGEGLQTVFGVANLAQAITVGAYDGRRVSPRSSSGPAIDGSVKPDLVAPSGIVGVLPAASALTRTLDEAGVLDPRLQLPWEPPSEARARLDSSLTSAALVAAAAGGLAHEGIRDTNVIRGALVAASVPLAGEPVWRQGAGVLRGVPDASFAASRPLALGHASLGAEPDDGDWSVLVPFSSPPSDAAATLDAFAGVGPDAETVTRSVGSSQAPEMSVGVSDRGVRVSAGAGDSRWRGGLYCGYTQVQVPASGGATIDPTLTFEGVPSGVEQVPTCLVQGSRLRGFGFYIHDLPASDLTFALLPHLPQEASLLHKPFTMLPVDPLKTKLYVKVTDAEGFADFQNVPPGWYTVRQFSDYGSPITQTLTDAGTGEPVVRDSDIGENPSYQDFDALVLGAAGITEADLRGTFGDGNVRPDPPTQGFWVTAGPREFRVVLDRFKKMPGPAVSSRVVDLLAYEDLDFNAVALSEALNVPALGAIPVAGDLNGWSFARGGRDPAGVSAAFNPLLAAKGADDSSILGVAHYPFNLTTPNYTMHLSLNFSYEVTNAAIVAVVNAGETWAAGVVTPQGTLRTPTVGTTVPIGDGGVAVSGEATGLANFEFDLKPLGARQGHLYLVFVPSRPVQELAGPLVSASVGDMSMAYDTWQRVLWPAAMTPHGMGHTFTIDPNFSHRQMSASGCRFVSSGGVSADVCEDWVVMIHSPGDDAETMDLVSAQGSIVQAIRGGGSLYADPRRGVADFSTALAFVLPGPGVPAELALSAEMPFRTNGRFWEQLALTKDTLSETSGPLLVEIVDNLPGRASALAPHVEGGVGVGPYVPFESTATVVNPYGMSLEEGVPGLAQAVPGGSAALALVGESTGMSSATRSPAPEVVLREAERVLRPVRLRLRRR